MNATAIELQARVEHGGRLIELMMARLFMLCDRSHRADDSHVDDINYGRQQSGFVGARQRKQLIYFFCICSV